MVDIQDQENKGKNNKMTSEEKIDEIFTKVNGISNYIKQRIDFTLTDIDYFLREDVSNKITGIGSKVEEIKDGMDGLQADPEKIAGIDSKVDKIIADAVKITGIGSKVEEIKDRMDGIKADTDKILDSLPVVDLNKENSSALYYYFNSAVEKVMDDHDFTKNVLPILEAHFEGAARKAGASAQEWFESNVRNIMQKPVFEVPDNHDSPLSWDW